MAAFVALAGYSAWILLGVTRSIPEIGPTLFWIVAAIWVLTLTILLVKPFNIAALKAAGAREPTGDEWRSLQPLWRQVQDEAGVAPGRYVLLVADEPTLIHKDLGWYVVAVGESPFLGQRELAAVLAQRLARQTSWTAFLAGLCVWAAFPLVVSLALGLVVVLIVRIVARIINAVADNLNPKTEGQAAAGCILYLVAAIAFAIMLAISLTVALLAAIGLIVLIAIAWLVRLTDAASSAVTVSWGYGADLHSALIESNVDGSGISRWLRPLSTYGSLRAHLAQLERAGVQGHGGDEVE